MKLVTIVGAKMLEAFSRFVNEDLDSNKPRYGNGDAAGEIVRILGGA